MIGIAPPADVVCINRKAEDVGGDEAYLGSAKGDHADDDAIDGCKDPSVPVVASDKDGGDNGEHARDVVEAEQKSE